MNENGSISYLTLDLILSGCRSLKEKRSILSPMISRLRKEFNVSVAEIGFQDKWDQARLGCGVVSNDGKYNQKVLAEILNYVTAHFLDVEVDEFHIESR